MVVETSDLGTCVREERSVESFERVILDGIGHVDVTQGDVERLVVDAPEDLQSRIETASRSELSRSACAHAGFRSLSTAARFATRSRCRRSAAWRSTGAGRSTCRT